MRSIESIMQGLSHRITLSIGKRYSSKIQMHFVCGFPRSGTTWFSELLADYLNLPRPRHYLLPIAFTSVIHTHSEPEAGIEDCFYVIRDGRDAITSMYFYHAQKIKQQTYSSQGRFRKIFDENFDVDEIDKYLPRYVEHVFKHPIGTRSHWGKHTIGWLNIKNGLAPGKVVIVRYEALLEDTENCFKYALMCKYKKFDGGIAQDAINRQDFHRQKKRSIDQQRTLLRKGITGDWKNYWNRESAQVFDHFAGDALIELGYEKDHSWIDTI